LPSWNQQKGPYSPIEKALPRVQGRIYVVYGRVLHEVEGPIIEGDTICPNCDRVPAKPRKQQLQTQKPPAQKKSISIASVSAAASTATTIMVTAATVFFQYLKTKLPPLFYPALWRQV
jgi:hypothetical protein